DSGGPLHAIVHGAPGSDKIAAIIHGKAAHAGANPEDGINAILIAAQAIAGMPLGRIDEVTTANIGMIEGGQAVNIVPDRVQIRGETRSHDEAKLVAQTMAIRAALESAVAAHPGARLELDIERTYSSYRLGPETPLLRRIAQTLAEMGEPEPVWRLVGGGSDANVFNANGLTAVPISTGMSSVHTNDEFIVIDDMVKSAEFLRRMIEHT
ncbi:MAG: M20/M25/M40 family metallo-hydrolase, partial [Anaerolineae bacterium]|nr:M20/M25/M40 family metallo-hydrolase [Anaerolineae bacterium]